MRKELIFALAAGTLSGLLHSLPAGGGFGTLIIALLAPLPLFAAGLSAGLSGALVAGAAGIALSAVMADDIMRVVVFTGVLALPIAVLTRQALLQRTEAGVAEWYPPGALLAWLAGMGVLVAAAFMALLAYFDKTDELRDFLAKTLAQFPQYDEAAAVAVADIMAPLVPGMVGGSWMLSMMLNGVLAQGLLVGFRRNLRPSPKIGAIELPRPLVVLWLVALAATLLPGAASHVGLTILVVLGLPLFMQGLSVLHAMAARASTPVLLLVVIYVMLVMFYVGMIPLLALVGVIEHWVKIRARLQGRAGPDQEDE